MNDILLELLRDEMLFRIKMLWYFEIFVTLIIVLLLLSALSEMIYDRKEKEK